MLACDARGRLTESTVADLPAFVVPGDVFVLNDSRVQPARIDAVKDSGGRAEMLLLERRPDGTWLAMIKASHAPKAGRRLVLGASDDAARGGPRREAGGGASGEATAEIEILRREGDLFVLGVLRGDLGEVLRRSGRPPLPPYIRREPDLEDVARYQTTFARAEAEWSGAASSVAAPTAGLHLTPEVMGAMERAGATFARVTLGVGPGTFRPIEAERVEDHRMHEEPFEVGASAAAIVNDALARGGRVTAVGTTSLRAIEAAATPGGRVRAVRGQTGLYCLPGTSFRVVGRLMTNFHRPGSTLLALVAAFAGIERALEIHRQGVARGFRLFSYGDATLIERAS